MKVATMADFVDKVASQFFTLADLCRAGVDAIDQGDAERARAILAGLAESMERDARAAREAVNKGRARPKFLPM